MIGLVKSENVLLNWITSSGNHDNDPFVLAQFLDHMGCLESQLSCWNQNKALDRVVLHVHLLNHWNRVRSSLSGTVLGSCDDVLLLERHWDALLLNWRWIFVAHLIDTQLQLF